MSESLFLTNAVDKEMKVALSFLPLSLVSTFVQNIHYVCLLFPARLDRLS